MSSDDRTLSPLPLLPLRHGVLFPGTVISIPVGRARSVTLVEALSEGDELAIAVQRDPEVDDPGIADLFPIATRAVVRKKVQVRKNRYQLVLEGQGRVRIESLSTAHPHWRAEISAAPEIAADSPEARALVDSIRERLDSLGTMTRELKQRLAQASTQAPGRFADLLAAALDLPADKEFPLLLELDIPARLRLIHERLLEAEAMAEIRKTINGQVQKELGKHQREMLLRQQLQAIQKELGEDEDGDATSELRDKIAALELPEEVAKAVSKEMRRLERMNSNQPEHHMLVKYLELVAELPWDRRVDTDDEIAHIEAKLDADHYGLEDVKKRVLEHLAVRKVTGGQRGAILCLVGPPGVGKTSLGQSIADATGRPFVRVALGGVRDEAEIRGHRRTYIGALPGRILRAMTKAGVKNPIVLLDEIDKLGQGWGGSPEAALLEVLDPEQNHTFTDHYLEQPFDLSEVLFLCTANTLETLSPPLRDRLEIVELQGYTVQEKVHIARNHLLPKKLEEHGLTADSVSVSDAALQAIVHDYTREAGVRQLARELTRACRAVTLERARRPEEKVATRHIDEAAVSEYLGKPRFFDEAAERTAIPGIATGLAWTPVGGDILFIETSRMPGKGRIETTGKLGEVMKESARAALSYVRSHADELGVSGDFLEREDVHIHVPAGATPKDGPSAGVTIFTALSSLLTGRCVRADTAMTGECTLRGRVLPVGGIKSKVLAAHRAGLSRVILPSKNRRDIDEVPEDVREQMEFIFAEDMSQVLAAALESVAYAPAHAGGRAHGHGSHGEAGGLHA
ncbi:endopeptidase La [Haliangium ochraceum]|uniref:Lon protease n=1 Tax=Haliangium ochraceum (strain DSM 14365 / JCM 11303 / SMP-2) TaxID=502025 RepID=D0LT44_HALO1|nr:endopeptidase La [Haliangium ochraceum]ACY19180.1 ATP-dependent protease La [Haliangium ochraceum DSM 14365]